MKISNKKWVIISLAIVIGMGALAFASVPLYRIFCQFTGYDGTVRRASAAPQTKSSEHSITIRFNADINKDLPWLFQPKQKQITVKLGEQSMAYYMARNIGSTSTTGTATYNVTPGKAAVYFNKVQCFCFTKQTLLPGQQMDFPVSFFIDPEIANDNLTSDLDTITLSYTFFPEKK